MIHAVTPSRRRQYAQQMDAMFTARHALYVEGRGWEDLRREDGREQDQFDHQDAIYLMALDSDQALEGGLRLVPSSAPHMLSDVFSHLCTGQSAPTGPDVFELSRVFVSHESPRDPQGRLIKGKLMVALYEFCLRHGIGTLTSVCDTYFLPRLLESGLDVRPLGLPQPYETGEMVAISMAVRSGDVALLQHNYGIDGGMLVEAPFPEWTSPVEGNGSDSVEAAAHRLDQMKDQDPDLTDLLEELQALMPRLASKNPAVVRRAESSLDGLAHRARYHVAEREGGHSGTLN
ncbi:acyl-homoserine-lactone synthase [Yunchengibacter salinarum]|uniref:acyl-homoserine-lactone synthase n=1 Tax=Yunchengibacter salinarum TaxID=3133399 RepID=UPI0035B5CC51